MFRFMLTTGLMLALLAGLVKFHEVAEAARTKQVTACGAEYKEFVCSTDEQIDQAVDWLDSHGYSEIAAEKVDGNAWKVFGYMGPDYQDDHRPRPACE